MARTPQLMEALRKLAGPGPDEIPDEDLVARYVTAQDGEAFESLVRRHGGLVWGTCRRMVRDSHLAEDAFQATFLALARHAASVRKPAAIAAWLHRVAVRCTTALRQPRGEVMTASLPDLPARDQGPAEAVAGRDLEQVIDAEIDALLDPFRTTFLLCEVEQRTASDVARELGCPVGTVESRLTRARERLREQLRRRGVTAGSLMGLGLCAGAIPATARAGAVAMASSPAGAPALWIAVADKAVQWSGSMAAAKVLTVMCLGLLGLGSYVWIAGAGAEADGLVAGGGSGAGRPTAADDANRLPPPPEEFRRNRFNFPLPREAMARVGDPFLRHGVRPDQMAFSADNRLLATAANGDRWLRIWDVVNEVARFHLPLAEGESAIALALSADGGRLRTVIRAADGKETQLREYHAYRGIEVRRRKIGSGVGVSATFSPDGRRLAIVAGDRLQMISAETGAEAWATPLGAATPSKTSLVFAGEYVGVLRRGSDRIELFGWATGRPSESVMEPGETLTHPVASSDGRRLAAWCPDKERLVVWSVADRKVVRRVSVGVAVSALAISPDGADVIGFPDRESHAFVWSVDAASKDRRLADVDLGCRGCFSPDGGVLAVASETGTVQLIDRRAGRLHPSSPTEVFSPVPIEFDLHGERLLTLGLTRWLEYSASGDDRPREYHPGTGNDEAMAGTADRSTVSPDRRWLARCRVADRTRQSYFLEVLDTTTGERRAAVPLDDPVRRPTFSPDSSVLYAVGGDRRVYGWDPATGRRVMRSTERAGDLVRRLVVSTDGRYLATASLVVADVQRPNSIQVWDTRTGEPVLAAEASNCRPFAAFSPDGRLFAAVVSVERKGEPASETRVWDLDARDLVVSFPNYGGQPAFSPDGRTLAVTHDDSVVLLELATGKPRHEFRHHGRVAQALAWKPDGRAVAAASPEAPVYLWDVVGDRTGVVEPWSQDRVDQVWQELSGRDPAKAFRALRQLWANPPHAVPFLRQRVSASAMGPLASRACEALELLATSEAKELLVTWALSPGNSPRAQEARQSLRRLGVETVSARVHS